MAGADVGGGGGGHQKGKKKKKKRLSWYIDMTPMVDVILLLLTFFMLTTVFSKPQTMELNLPEKGTVEVPESILLILRVGPNRDIYWNMGNDPLALKRIEFKDLRALLEERIASIPKLITLVQIDRNAKYNDMVDVLDELNVAKITRFSIAPLTENDKKLMAKAGR